MVNFPTADDLLDEVNAVVSILVPLPLPQVAAALRKGFLELFQMYTSAVASAFANHKTDGRLPESLGAGPPPVRLASAALYPQWGATSEVTWHWGAMMGHTHTVRYHSCCPC